MRSIFAGFHRIAHLLQWNHGIIDTWWTDEGYLKVGYFCSTCGQIDGIEVLAWVPPDVILRNR